VLVRPDNHVAWRSAHPVADPTAVLTRTLQTVLSCAR
jgi:hypothetical protein